MGKERNLENEKYFDTLIVLGRTHYILTNKAEYSLPEKSSRYLTKAYFVKKQMRGILYTLNKIQPNVIKEILNLTKIQKMQSSKDYLKNMLNGKFFQASEDIKIGEACNIILDLYKEISTKKEEALELGMQ